MKLSFKLIRSMFKNFHIILIINISIIIKVLSSNDNPSEIKNNYYLLELLSSGDILNLNNDIICSYNLYFSEKINNKKNIFCIKKNNIYI